MVSIDDLKKILILQDLTFPMLEKMQALVQYRDCKEREILFNEGDRAEFFYLLKKGKVLLEVEISPRVMMSLGSIKSGNSFGWGALALADPVHHSNAICTEPSEVLAVAGGEFLRLLEKDPEVGYRVMKNIFSIFMRRLERRKNQLVNVIRNYPGLKDLVQE
jgi:CRP-like cAMP-binding protein